MSADELISAFQDLPAAEQAKAQVAIRQVRSLGPPPTKTLGALWIMVVGAFVFLRIGGTAGLFVLIFDDKPTDVVFPLVSGALGVLAGRLAPSPAAQQQQV